MGTSAFILCLCWTFAITLSPCSAKKGRHTLPYGAACSLNDCRPGMSCTAITSGSSASGKNDSYGKCKCGARGEDCLQRIVNVTFIRNEPQNQITLHLNILQEGTYLTLEEARYVNTSIVGSNQSVTIPNSDAPPSDHGLDASSRSVSLPLPRPGHGYRFLLVFNNSLEQGNFTLSNVTYINLPAIPREIEFSRVDPYSGFLTVRWQQDGQIGGADCMLEDRSDPASTVTVKGFPGNRTCFFHELPPLKNYSVLHIQVVSDGGQQQQGSVTVSTNITLVPSHMHIPKVIKEFGVVEVDVTHISMRLEELPPRHDVTAGYYVVSGSGQLHCAFQRSSGCPMPSDLPHCRVPPLPTITATTATPSTEAWESITSSKAGALNYSGLPGVSTAIATSTVTPVSLGRKTRLASEAVPVQAETTNLRVPATPAAATTAGPQNPRVRGTTTTAKPQSRPARTAKTTQPEISTAKRTTTPTTTTTTTTATKTTTTIPARTTTTTATTTTAKKTTRARLETTTPITSKTTNATTSRPTTRPTGKPATTAGPTSSTLAERERTTMAPGRRRVRRAEEGDLVSKTSVLLPGPPSARKKMARTSQPGGSKRKEPMRLRRRKKRSLAGLAAATPVTPAPAADDDANEGRKADATTGQVFLLTVGDLSASTVYNLMVTPWFCVDDHSLTGGSVSASVSVTTWIEVKNLTVVEQLEHQDGHDMTLHVEWTSLPVPLDVNYTVYLTDLLWDVHGHNDLCPAEERERGRKKLCHVSYKEGECCGGCQGSIHQAFWEYNITLEATTKYGVVPSVSTTTLTTKPRAPGRIPLLKAWTKLDVRHVQCGTKSLTNRFQLCVMWQDPCPTDRNSLIDDYSLTLKRDDEEDEKGEIYYEMARFANLTPRDYRRHVTQAAYYVIVNVTQNSNYTVTIFARGRRDDPDDSHIPGDRKTILVRIPEVHGPNISEAEVAEAVPEESVKPGKTSIRFRVKDSFFLKRLATVGSKDGGTRRATAVAGGGDGSSSTSAGHGVILTASGKAPLSYHSKEEFDTYKAWSNDTDVLENGGYRIVDETLQNVHAADGPITVTIGDKTCDQSAQQGTEKYCDGPLQEGITYTIWVYVCNDDDCARVALVKNITTAAGPEDLEESLGQVQAIVVAICFCIFILGGVFAAWYCCFRNKSTKMKMDQNQLSEWNTLQSLKEPRAKRPMNLVNLENIICKKQRDDSLLLREEYEDIVSSHTDPVTGRYKHLAHHTGDMEVNRTKNRYNDIVTYDHSRVKLSRDKECSDFINANFIPGYKTDKDFIATQGPLPFTAGDFWRMVWEHNVSIIIMLTLTKEDGRHKCEQYWPPQRGETSEYDDMKVTNTSTSTVNDYTITIFSLHNTKSRDAEREVLHFQYLKWKDMTGDVTVDSLLEFHKVVKQHAHPDRLGPIVVHCSAGVGRTGAFIALDYIQQAIAERSMKDDLDIYGLIMRLRQFRCNIVQTVDQYILIHQCARMLMAIRRRQEVEQGIGRCSYAPSTSSVILSNKGSQDSLHWPEMDGAGGKPESQVRFSVDCQASLRSPRVTFMGDLPTDSTDHLFVP